MRPNDGNVGNRRGQYRLHQVRLRDQIENQQNNTQVEEEHSVPGNDLDRGTAIGEADQTGAVEPNLVTKTVPSLKRKSSGKDRKRQKKIRRENNEVKFITQEQPLPNPTEVYDAMWNKYKQLGNEEDLTADLNEYFKHLENRKKMFPMTTKQQTIINSYSRKHGYEYCDSSDKRTGNAPIQITLYDAQRVSCINPLFQNRQYGVFVMNLDHAIEEATRRMNSVSTIASTPLVTQQVMENLYAQNVLKEKNVQQYISLSLEHIQHYSKERDKAISNNDSIDYLQHVDPNYVEEKVVQLLVINDEGYIYYVEKTALFPKKKDDVTSFIKVSKPDRLGARKVLLHLIIHGGRYQEPQVAGAKKYNIPYSQESNNSLEASNVEEPPLKKTRLEENKVGTELSSAFLVEETSLDSVTPQTLRRESFPKFLTDNNFVETDFGGNGDCLVQAYTGQRIKSENMVEFPPMQLRRLIVQYISHHRSIIHVAVYMSEKKDSCTLEDKVKLFNPELSFDEYLVKMSQETTFMDEACIHALANISHCEIIVYSECGDVISKRVYPTRGQRCK